MKKLLMAVLFFSTLSTANTQTHNVYIHKSGIDTSIYKNQQQASTTDFSQLNNLTQRVREKREAKKVAERQSAYSLDLLDATDGLKNINVDNIRPLIQKYPEKSEELLEMLRKAN